MGKRASSALCLALTVALVLAAVALGAYRGWSGERRQALETFTENTALRDYLEERSMDAANLRVVAARHLDREDEDLVLFRLKFPPGHPFHLDFFKHTAPSFWMFIT